MSPSRLHILHDDQGTILSVGRLIEQQPELGVPEFDGGFEPRKNQQVLDLAVDGSMAEKRIDEIQEMYRVDLKNGRLAPKDEGGIRVWTDGRRLGQLTVIAVLLYFLLRRRNPRRLA